MSEDQRVGAPDGADYESPSVEDLDTTEGPAVTAAGESKQ
jgi:hypothetical protein